MAVSHNLAISTTSLAICNQLDSVDQRTAPDPVSDWNDLESLLQNFTHSSKEQVLIKLWIEMTFQLDCT